MYWDPKERKEAQMSTDKCMCMGELCVVVHTENACFQLGKEEVS